MRSRRWYRRIGAAGLTVTSAVLLAACGGSTITAGSSGGGTILLWTHNAGNNAELAADEKVVKDFNASQSKFTVKVQAFPQTSYNAAVFAAASAGKLPCVLDVDSPNVPNWAWGGYLSPLDLSSSQVPVSAQLPSTVGKYNGKVYSFGLYDVAMAMMTRKSVLERAGIRIPTIDSPWSRSEFNDALAKLKATGKFEYPLDLQTASVGTEWAPYAWSPLLQSFGGDLINRSTYRSAQGVLNGPDAVAWAKWFRGLVAKGYMAQQSGTSSNADFLNGKTAIVWDGIWDAVGNIAKLGKDVLFLPPPNLGTGPKIGGGSWQWAMSRNCKAKNGAREFLNFMRQTKYFASLAKATGTIPAAYAAADQDPDFKPGGPLNIFLQYAKKFAVVRPVTPAYPFISTTFQQTAADILAGANAKSALNLATREIDNNIKTNDGYAS